MLFQQCNSCLCWNYRNFLHHICEYHTKLMFGHTDCYALSIIVESVDSIYVEITQISNIIMCNSLSTSGSGCILNCLLLPSFCHSVILSFGDILLAYFTCTITIVTMLSEERRTRSPFPTLRTILLAQGRRSVSFCASQLQYIHSVTTLSHRV